MININLLGEEKDRSASYLIHAASFCFVTFLFICVAGSIFARRSLYLSEMESEKNFKHAQNESLKKRTAEVEDLEAKQVLLKDKLNIIAQLKAKKQGPVRILDQISSTIPDKAWLTEISQADDILQVTGVALDGQTISDFMGKLRDTPNITETDSVSTELTVIEDLKLQKFSFPAKLFFLKKADAEKLANADENKEKNKSK